MPSEAMNAAYVNCRKCQKLARECPLQDVIWALKVDYVLYCQGFQKIPGNFFGLSGKQLDGFEKMLKNTIIAPDNREIKVGDVINFSQRDGSWRKMKVSSINNGAIGMDGITDHGEVNPGIVGVSTSPEKFVYCPEDGQFYEKKESEKNEK